MIRTARLLLGPTIAVLLVVPVLTEAQQKPRPKTPAKPAAPAASPAKAALQRAVSVKELERNLNAINFDRTSGKEGERKAAAYVEQRLRQFGVKYTRHDARVLVSWPVKAEVALFGETTGSLRAVAPAFGVSTPPAGLTAEAVVLAGPLDDRGPGQDVRGKILVVPGPVAPESVARAPQTGAVGLIFVSETDTLHEGSASPVRGMPTADSRAWLPKLPIVTVNRGSGDRLRSAVARGPVAVRIVAEVQQQWVNVPIVVADVPGSSPEFVLVAAHLDAWYEGMTDSGSGVASLLEMARVVQPQRAKLRRGIRFAWWGGHTAGNLAGSTWYLDRFWNEMDRLCVAHMSVEGTGRRGSRIEGIGAGGWPAVNEFARQAARMLSPRTVLPATDAAFRPDRDADSSFQGIGISEFWIGVPGPAKPSGDVEPSGRVKYWHTKDDKLDKVDLKVLTLDTQYRVAAVYEMAAAPVVPLQLAPVANAFVRALEDLSGASASRFDLTSTRAAATALAAAASRLDGQTRPSRADAIAALNRLLIRLSHRLSSTLYSRAGRLDQDPVGELRVLPLLSDIAGLAKLAPDSEDVPYLETQLIRARNTVESVLREATDEIQAYLGGPRT